jgi:hypothetical protein
MNWSSVAGVAAIAALLGSAPLQAGAVEVVAGSSLAAQMNEGMIQTVVIVRGAHGGAYAGRPGGVHAYRPGYRPGYHPGYRPGYHPGYRPGYPGYRPGYAGGWARPGGYWWGRAAPSRRARRSVSLARLRPRPGLRLHPNPDSAGTTPTRASAAASGTPARKHAANRVSGERAFSFWLRHYPIVQFLAGNQNLGYIRLHERPDRDLPCPFEGAPIREIWQIGDG